MTVTHDRGAGSDAGEATGVNEHEETEVVPPEAPAPAAPHSGQPALTLVRAEPPSRATFVPDEDQRRVIDRRAGSGPVIVVGGPGTGKTSTLIEAVAARVVRDAVPAEAVLVLAPTRVAAAALRDRITGRITASGRAALCEPPVRTAASYAFSLIRREAVRSEQPVPRLISGPEQDAILADLLAGHAAGEGIQPGWPEAVRPALALRGFRHELRDLLMRAMERGIDPAGLARLGRRHRRPEWQAAARLFQEYLDVTSLATPGAFDPAALVDEAASLLAADPDLLNAERARVRLIAVDDHHESSEAVARLLDQLAPPDADLILTGDPDATTLSFRGAQSRLLGEAPQRHRSRHGDAPVVVLGTSWRHGPALAEALRRVSARIGAQPPEAARRRAPLPVGPAADRPGEVAGTPDRPAARTATPVGEEAAARSWLQTALVRSGGAQTAFIAQHLRTEHLLHGVPWSQQVVIARTGGQAAALRRGLAQAGVPIGHSTAEVALRDEPAVRALLLAAEASLHGELLDQDDIVVALLTTLGQTDHLRLRQLRAALVRAERAAGGSRTSTELLGSLLAADPDDLEELIPAGLHDHLVAPVHRVVRVLGSGRAALAAPSATAESVLWSVWESTGHAELWRGYALGGGRRGRRADRDLDTVVALFEAAARFADRMPGAGAAEFIERLREQELPEDTVAARAALGETVLVTTPQSVLGREFEVAVVAGLQDGIWPNTRLRGSLLGSTDLVDLHAGREIGQRGRGAARDPAALRAARTEVLHDELRMVYVALSRARRRVLVTAVSNADEVPSPFLDLIDPLEGADARPVTRPGPPVSLAGVVMQLRGQLADADDLRRQQAAAQLNRLARDGVRGADPADWYGLGGLSETAPLSADRRVSVSPSSLEEFAKCPLRWLFGRSGGQPPAPAATGIGTLVHDLAHEFPSAGTVELQDELARRWPELNLGDGWVSDQLQARAEQMLAFLVSYRQRQQGTVIGRELDFTVVVGAARLTGRIDQLERTDAGDLVAVDLKTTRNPPANKEVEAHPQLGAYQLAVDRGAFTDVAPGAASGGARLVHLGARTQRVKVQDQGRLSAAADPEWADKLVREAAEGMSGGRFAATVNDGCRHCSLRSSCPAQAEGRQVGR